jgi:hypothetical protein
MKRIAKIIAHQAFHQNLGIGFFVNERLLTMGFPKGIMAYKTFLFEDAHYG